MNIQFNPGCLVPVYFPNVRITPFSYWLITLSPPSPKNATTIYTIVIIADMFLKRGNELFEDPGPLARRGKGGNLHRKKVCCRAKIILFV